MKSDSLKNGMQNAPHRALYHALGLTDEEIGRPMVGIVSSYNEIVPGHMNIDKITDGISGCSASPSPGYFDGTRRSCGCF